MHKRFRLVIFTILALFFAFVMADAVGVFNKLPYDEIPHGNHAHYVPKDRDPNVPIGQFPTRPPGPNERITPQGQIVAK
jgi:hypothetical protein